MQENFQVGKYKLDNNQMKLLYNDSNSLVIAGAGSGKTLTIIGKIYYLIEKQNVNPKEILLISFTNATVNDLKTRIKYEIPIYTFHKLAMFILEKNKISYSICETNLLNFIIKEYLFTCSKKEQKIILKFLKINNSYNLFLKSNKFKNFCNMIETFINLYKTNSFDYSYINKIYYSKIEKKLLLIIFKIYQIYIDEKNSINSLDFDDLIILASKKAANNKFNFKYIIIDEFQDCSYIRLNLIKNIFINSNSKIIVVGDDWQSIYHFTGCDLNIFLNFANFFPNIKIIKLLYTYRNSQELINIASKFILKNKNQIKKELNSPHNYSSPIIFVPYLYKKNTFKRILDNVINNYKDILILSRNNNDIYEYLNCDMIIKNNTIFYKNFNIKFMTIHKSKGLEADCTILLNCNNDFCGFPNKIENHKIINKLFLYENIPYAEERRLFYVALTRCKKNIYILYNKNNPSLFINELKKIIKSDLGNITYFK